MADYTQIKDRLALLTGCDAAELEQYESVIEDSADYVLSVLNDSKDFTEPAVQELCAARAYLKIAVCRQTDDVVSFRAGDVSFTKKSSDIDKARELYSLAQSAAAEYITDGTFAFKAV
jgi:hypothetical protein